MTDIEKTVEFNSKTCLANECESDFLRKLRLIPCLGIFLGWFSAVCYATATFTVELMEDVDPTFVVFARSIIQLLFFLIPILYNKDSILGHPEERYQMFERSFFTFISFLLSFVALDYISFSDSQSIIFASPVITSIMGYFILKESCGITHVIVLVATVVGVFSISRPVFIFGVTDQEDVFTPEERTIGLIICIITCLLTGYVYITMRKLQKTSSTANVGGYSLFCVLAASLVMNMYSFITGSMIRIPGNSRDWILVIINGLIGIVGQLCSAMAVRIEEAGLVSIMRSFDIVMAFMYQAAFLNQPIHWTSIMGALVISSGCIVVSSVKYYESKAKKAVRENE